MMSKFQWLRELLTEDHWTKIALARDRLGNTLVNPLDAEACRWCLEGACMKIDAGCDYVGSLREAIRRTIQKCTEYDEMHHFNDSNLTNHRDVLKLIDQAEILYPEAA